MLEAIFRQLDKRIGAYNREAEEEGFAKIPQSLFKVVGQTALFEANLSFELRATQDVDAYVKAHHWVIKSFDEILARYNKKYDPHSNEIWMPVETKYCPIFKSTTVEAFVAEPDYVILSKALKAPVKNRDLVANYVKNGASNEFFKLALKYKLDVLGVLK